MKIHKEGFKILFVVSLFLLIIDLTGYFLLSFYAFVTISIILILWLAFLFRFFRVPHRQIASNENDIIAPADGTIVAIEEVFEDEFLQRKCIQVSTFMSIWNVHINWFSVAGIVKYYKYHPGNYLVAKHPKSSTMNERTTIVVERKDGVLILMRQIAGAVARRIVSYANVGKQVEQCSELGFIKFGSRVDLFLPTDAIIRVSLNQKVRGTQTIIAEIPTRNPL